MENGDIEGVTAFVLIVVIIGVFAWIIGWLIGESSAVTNIKQEICKGFMEKTTDYINCNSNKSIDEIIKMINEKK